MPDKRLIEFDAKSNHFVVSFDYDRALVQLVKEDMPSARWTSYAKQWILPRNVISATLLSDFSDKHAFSLSDAAAGEIRILIDAATYIERKILERLNCRQLLFDDARREFVFYSPSLDYYGFPTQDGARGPGIGGPRGGLFVSLPESFLVIEPIFSKIRNLNECFVSDEAIEAICRLFDGVRGRIIQSYGADGDQDMRDVAAQDYLVESERSFLIDENEERRALRAIKAIRALNASPVLIICDHKKTSEWMARAVKMFPAGGVAEAGDDGCDTAQVVICKTRKLASQSDLLSKIALKGLIVDGSEAFAGYKSARTIGICKISDACNIRARFLLTNNAYSGGIGGAASQLRVLGRLSEMGGFGNLLQERVESKRQWGLRHGAASNGWVVERMRNVGYFSESCEEDRRGVRIIDNLLHTYPAISAMIEAYVLRRSAKNISDTDADEEEAPALGL